MASSGKVRLAQIIGTLIAIIFSCSTGAVLADDGLSADSAGSGLFAIETHEVLPPGALTASQAIKTTTAATLLDDGFEGSFPGGTWQLYHDSAGADLSWGKSSYRKSSGSYSVWCGASGSAAPGTGGNIPINTNTWVFAGPFDLSSATSGELTFDLWLTTEANYDHFKWLASTDGSNFSGFRTSTNTTGFQTVVQDLSDWGSAGNVLGQSQIWIAFVYESDNGTTYEGAYVDQVSLTTNGGGGGSNCGTYVLSEDNDNNSYTGTPDGDWGYCLYNNDSKHPIEFHFDVNESSITSAQLLLLCHDVDQYTEAGNPEIDKVYVNNTYIGDLTGANNEDSTTIFTLPVSNITPGTNRVRVDVNQNPGTASTKWCVKVVQAQLIINGGCTGQASCRSVTTNSSSYAPGSTVAVTYEIDTSASSQQVRVESNLLNPDGTIVAGAERNYTTNGTSNDPKTVNLALPGAAVGGAYKAQVLVFDATTGQLESSCESAFTVTGGGGGTCDITCTASAPTTAQVGQAVNFTSTASTSGDCGTVEYFWTPEQDYSTATIQSQNGTWVYQQPGTYTWTYAAIGDNGGRCDRSGTITVTAASTCTMTCNASVPSTAQVGQTVNLTGSVSTSGNCGTVEYFWFPDHTNTATIFDRNATWAYDSPGTYNWHFSAQATNGQCEKRGSINVTSGGGGAGVIWVPVVSHAGGANNSTWVSDLGIFNPSSVNVTVTITIYVSTGPITNTINVNAGGQVIITDIVGWFSPGLIASGPISISSSQTLIITSRTYNLLAAGIICFPTGTLGQGLAGVLTTGGISVGQFGWVPNLVEYGAFRSNIGYTNTGTTTARLTVRLYNGNGVQVGSYNVTLAPGQWKQANQPFRNTAGLTNMRAGSARVTVTSGSGVVIYGSVIDNITNDPTTIPFYR